MIARAMAREGMNLVLAARSQPRLEELANELRLFGVRVIAVPTDVAQQDQLRKLVDATLTEFGGLTCW